MSSNISKVESKVDFFENDSRFTPVEISNWTLLKVDNSLPFGAGKPAFYGILNFNPP